MTNTSQKKNVVSYLYDTNNREKLNKVVQVFYLFIIYSNIKVRIVYAIII